MNMHFTDFILFSLNLEAIFLANGVETVLGLKQATPSPQKTKQEQRCAYSRNQQFDMPEGKTRRKFPVIFFNFHKFIHFFSFFSVNVLSSGFFPFRNC